MELIQETPEEVHKDGTGRKLDFEEEVEGAAEAISSDDDYEDDNDFEPFETSKKDFYQGDSIESKT